MNSITIIIDVLILSTVTCFIFLLIKTGSELNERISSLENMVTENKTKEGVMYGRYLAKVTTKSGKK